MQLLLPEGALRASDSRRRVCITAAGPGVAAGVFAAALDERMRELE